MPRSAHRQQLIKQYPSLINGDPYFRTLGHAHLGRRIIFSRPNHTIISGLTTTRRLKVVKGTIIGFLSESDVDKSGNAAFVATKSSKYSRKGEPSKLFHIVLDEKDEDNDNVVLDMEEWEIDEYCEWIAADEEEEKSNIGEGQEKQHSSSRKHSQPTTCNDGECTKTTEFEKLNNLALEAAASVSNAPAVVEKAINIADDGKTSLEEAAAAGCTKCKKELETGQKVRGAHVGHCPRKGMWKSEGKLGKSDRGGKSRDNADAQSSEKKLGKSDRGGKSRDNADAQSNEKKLGKSRDNAYAQSCEKKIDSSSSGECENEGRLGQNQNYARTNNLALEVAASVSNAPTVVEKAINIADDGKASLAEAAATGCTKCKKELETGQKVRGAHVGHCPRKGMWKSEGKLGKSDRGGNSRDNADAQSSEKKIDSSSSGECENEGRLGQNYARALASAPCPSYNDFLKSALASYSSNTRKKNTNNPPPPIPPPFLSHEENCTLRTALAFVMARARNKDKSNNDGMSLPHGSIPTAVENTAGKITADRTGDGWSHGHTPLVGGLLALPPRDCASIGQMNLNVSNAKIELGRELKHVRDVMNLAVSALLPLYKSTLQGKSDESPGANGRRQCAVYDFESAAKPSSLRGSQFQLPASEHHLATLDGLCRHIIGRLSSIVNDKALRRKLTNESLAKMPKGTSQDEHTEFSINSDGNAPEDEAKKDIVRDSVAQLQMDFMINAICHSSETAQQIHHIMASCHVLHRLLLLDENCTTIGSDCVAMACTILTDLYHDKCIGGRKDGVSNQLRTLEGFRQVKEQDGKGKHQVVPSRWSYPASSYNANREERRKQALCAISQLCSSNGPLTGMKRSANQSHDESAAYQPIQLPRLGDVLAVNLLRLLEGASAIRLHFHRRYAGQNNGYFASKAATSAAAAEVLQEVRSKMDHDLLMPIHINDAAAAYYHEKLNSQERRPGKVDHLRPGAKMMLRIHLFGLIQKLSMYEQG